MAGTLQSLERKFAQMARAMYAREGNGVCVELLYQDDDEAAASAYWEAKYAVPWDAGWGPRPEGERLLVVLREWGPREERAPWQDEAAWAAQLGRQEARAVAERQEAERKEAARLAAEIQEARERLELVKAAARVEQETRIAKVAEFYAQTPEEEARGKMDRAAYAPPVEASEPAPVAPAGAPPAPGDGGAASLSLVPGGRRRPRSTDGRVLGG
jgi:hypothetical protein